MAELPLTISFINSLVKLNNNKHPATLQSDILSILQDSDDDDKPDRLKAFISKNLLLHLPDHQLNQIILALLHQHRQDLNPNSNHPVQQNQLPSDLLIINQSKLLTNRSRFQSQTCSNSNSSSSAPSTPPPSARIANQTNSNLPPPSKFPSIHLQWSDKLNASASEFKPSLSRAVSLPFRSTTPSHISRSPLAPPANSNHLWAYHPSSGLEHHHSPLQSPNGKNNNQHLYHQQQQQLNRYSRPATPEIPRDPWLRDDLDQKNVSNKSLSPNPIDYNSDEQDVAFDLFSPFHPSSPFKSPSLPPISTQPDEKIQQEPSCQTALQWGVSPEMAEEMAQFTVWDQSDSDGSLPPTIVHHPVEEDANTRYCMTPFDELSSALMGTGVTVNQIEQALSISDFDISKALDWLLERNGMLMHHHNPALLHTDQPSKFSASSRDSSLNRAGGAHHHPSSLPTSPRFAPVHLDSNTTHQSSQKRSKAASANYNPDDPPALELSPAHRICRFYLQGCCLRSDCKFSHDVGKAICRFWLKGNCLKGENRCDFLHEIPDVMSQQEKQEEEENNNAKKNNTLTIKSFADEFPSLNESLLSNNNNNRKSNQNNNHNKASRLRPVALLPDGLIDPSPSLLKLCQTYSSQSFEFSSRRKECFELAKECFKRGDGAGVKKWSKEGDQWNKKLGEEGRAVAGLMITERNRLMKDAVRELVSDRISKVDEAPDRMQRGKEMGGGICIGVVKPSTSSTSVKERTEVLMDLHGLQPEDGVYYLEKFLMALKTEGYQGLAYVILTTTGTTVEDSSNNFVADHDGKKLEKSVKSWLEKKKFYFDISSSSKIGLVCIDPLRKV